MKSNRFIFLIRKSLLNLQTSNSVLYLLHKLIMRRIVSLLFAMAFITNNSIAQFSLSGEFRPRSEYSHGYKSLAADNQKASLFTSQRTRINFDFKNDKLTTKLVLHDVRLWGSQAQSVGNEDKAVSVHEAWAEVALFDKFTLKAGRQEVFYNNQRIFGNGAWVQQSRSHDMALLKYSGAVKAHFGFAYHEGGDIKNNFYLGPDAYKAMQFLWVNKTFDKLDLSFLFLNNGKETVTRNAITNAVESVAIEYSQTYGAHIEHSMGGFGIAANAYLQGGKDGTGKELNAYEAALNLSVKVNDLFSLNTGFEILSGNTQINPDNVNRSFTPIYGTNHRFNGHMDYFYVGAPSGVGLLDIFFGTTVTRGKFNAELTGHMFSAAADINDAANPGTALNSYLGTEFDFLMGYKLNDWVVCQAGYSQMFGTNSMKAIRNGSTEATSNWAWLMFTFKPKFL